MNVTSDKQTGVYNIQFSEGNIEDSEINQNIVINYNKKGEMLSIEVFPFNIEEASKKKTISKT